MKLIDLSHTLSSQTQPYPGSTPPQIRQTALIEKNGYREKMLGLSSHLGTHVDAPAHMLPHGRTLDGFAVEKFYGRAFIIDARRASGPKGIALSVLQQIPENLAFDIILFYTGWSANWAGDTYFDSYPFFSEELAEALCRKKLKAVGIDGPSADAADSKTYPAHHLFLGSETLIIENLCNLEKLNRKEFMLALFPLKVKDADGSPVRAVAILDEDD